MEFNIESFFEKFFNTIFISVMLLLAKPLSAQTDSGGEINYEEAMQKVFYENGRDFILKNFCGL